MEWPTWDEIENLRADGLDDACPYCGRIGNGEPCDSCCGADTDEELPDATECWRCGEIINPDL